jgi:nitrogen-specific signal transduction histidine kinase
MEKNNTAGRALDPVGADFFERLWKESWMYIKAVVDVVREPVLILDKDLRVMAANESFYNTFQVELEDTEKKIVYDLGNGQWNIPSLKKLLEDILPKNTFFKGFEVTHDFPVIGPKVMILNARQIRAAAEGTTPLFPPIILLAMEDITEMMAVAETFANHTNQLESKLTDRTQKLESRMEALEKEIGTLKKAFV